MGCEDSESHLAVLLILVRSSMGTENNDGRRLWIYV